MLRAPRADEGCGIYHALNRANMRATIFKKEEDFAAFERILAEGPQFVSAKERAFIMWKRVHRE